VSLGGGEAVGGLGLGYKLKRRQKIGEIKNPPDKRNQKRASLADTGKSLVYEANPAKSGR